MEKQTILCTALPHGRAADGALRLSVLISPRLWSDNTAVAKLQLSQFPDWLAWPSLVGTATWSVIFDGQAPVNATVESATPRLDLWQALFKTDTDVKPFRFEDLSDAEIETIDSGLLHDTLAGLYARAATNPSYGAGRDLPKAEILASDPDLAAIARPSEEEIPPEPGPRPGPVDVGGTPPRPEPEPAPEPEPRPGGGSSARGCGCGCLSVPVFLLGRLFPRLGKWLDEFFGPIFGSDVADDDPPPQTPKPTSWPAADDGLPPLSPPVVAPAPPIKPPHITQGGPPSVKRAAFDEVSAFLTPPSDGSADLPSPAELEVIYDFHSMIATLGDYPKLLRLLGLVVDLRVEPHAGAPAVGSTVKIEPVLALATPSTLSSLRTNYTLSDAEFLARPRPVAPEIGHGFLRLDDTAQFRIIQVDVVGGAIKLQNAATNCAAFAKPEDRAPNMPDEGGLPALRTGGISVIRRDLKSELRETFRRSLALQLKLSAIDGSTPPPAAAAPTPTDELYAEDLVRGYRVDVFDTKSNAWHSLCQRRGRYEFLDAPGGKISLLEEDEGSVQFAATEPVKPTSPAKLKAGDSLFVWDGWSLCAPRPGRTIATEDAPDGSTILEKPKNEAATKFKLETAFTATPGTLPRLRFHYSYRLRARVCDLAGNSVCAPGDAAFAEDPAEQTPLIECARYEPVSPPAMILRAAPVEGESLERLVVRSPAVGGEAQVTERHVIPPKVSQLMAEQHGMFDAPPTMNGTPAGYALAKRESGALTDGATEVKEHTWVFAGPQFSVTYLPDPSARGAVLLGLPGLGAEEIVEPTAAKIVNKIPFDGAWPQSSPFRLRLVAIAAGAVPVEPDWNEANRVLTVQLAASAQAVVRLNSFLEPADFAVQGVAHWTKAEAPADFAKAEADTIAGRSWLHLPWRELTLVHAVQQPLEPAEITALTPDKQLGKTFVTLTGDMATHAASTGKVDVLAAWTDPIDDPTLPAPTTREHHAHVFELLIPPDGVSTPIPASVKQPKPLHEFADTKFHEVNYTTVATTRFREYFPPAITADPANLSVRNLVPVTRPVLNSARPDLPRVLYVVPAYEWQDIPQAPGTTQRVRRGGGLRVYLDRPWYSSGAGELLGVVFLPEVNFLSLTEKERTLVTHWGADPIWASPPADDDARMKNFTGYTERADGLSLAEFEKVVSVAGYLPEFDPVRRLWFADIQMEIGAAYAPFVRLALARFQPHSVKDAQLSRVVRADFVQLAAERTASVAVAPAAGGAKISITVKGPTYRGSSVTRTAEGRRDLFGADVTRRGLAEIEALLQRRNPDFGDEADLGWETIQTDLLAQNPANPGVWQGTVELTAPLVPGSFRLLLKEYEWYRADFQNDEAREGVSLARRVVYADTVILS